MNSNCAYSRTISRCIKWMSELIFLNGNLIDEIYMQQEGFLVQGKENIVRKLLKSL